VSDAAAGGAADAAARALALRLFQAMLATQESFTAYLGVKLGLYQVLHDRGPATARQLADRAGLSVRYVREWLEQQAAAGMLAVDEPQRAWQTRVYRLPPGHARVLTASADPMSLVWTAMLPLGGVAAALPHLLDAFRTGAGIPADVFGTDWRHGHGGANRALYTHELAGWIREHLPDIHQRLAGGSGKIADIGCGAGWASIALARAYPSARVTAVDVDGAAVAEAQQAAADAGVAGRVSFVVTDGSSLADEHDYDLVCVFDALHEVAHPADLLRACSRALRSQQGAVLVLESLVTDTFSAPASEIERFQYATSVLHCLPAGLVGTGAVGTGTVMRPAAVRAHARAAGFSGVRRYDVDDGFHCLYRLDSLA
jgi:2-polyprenyl-3-methyl-5-hydroxy-6-metoxy-1,4-benzoquinol methylase